MSLEQYIWFAKISEPDLGFHQVTVFLYLFLKELFEILCSVKNRKIRKIYLTLMLLINAGDLVILLQDIKPLLSLQIYYWIK